MAHQEVRVLALVLLLGAGMASFAGCRHETEAGTGRSRYVATVHPLAAILREVVGERGEVTQLLPPGVSPHTYEPRPSDVGAAEKSLALFYGAANLDGWAARLPSPRRVAFLDLVPVSQRLDMGEFPDAHAQIEGNLDPHFWMDPLTVKASLPALVEVLSELDPPGRATYEANARQFGRELDTLDQKVREVLAPIAGAGVVLHHPSVRYLLHRYGLKMVGVVEASPGKEPSPREILSLVDRMRRAGVKALFTEPQLSARPVQVIAEAAGLPMFTLDPNGGMEGRDSYAELILYNASTLRKALE